MKNPRIEINLHSISENAKKIVEISQKKGIRVWGVTKGVSGDIEVAKAMIKGGVVGLADSRIENLLRLKELNVPLMLLRIPMLSKLKDVVELVDVSLNSELKVIKEMDKIAQKSQSIHKIVLMVDLGDRREGLLPQDVLGIVKKIKRMSNVELLGLGTNMACFRGVVPSEYNMSKLTDLVNNIKEKLALDLRVISGGNSSSLPLILDDSYDPVTNELRLGESILLGREVPSGEKISFASLDTFRLVGELVELKEKPTINQGEQESNAFGERLEIIDRGVRKRGILAIGRQDIDPDALIPIDSKVIIEGASSDHLILDLTEVDNIEVGDEIAFRLGYSSLLRAMTSPYLHKVYIE